MMRSVHVILFLSIFILLTGASSVRRKKMVTINSTFVRNKKVWGTYKLTKERGKLNRKKLNYHQVGDIIIGEKNFHMIRSAKVQGRSKIIVEKFPYKKKGQDTYILQIKRKSKKLINLYTNALLNASKRSLKHSKFRFKQLICKRGKRRKIHCTLKAQIL
jgi:hypothetical protein